MAISRRRKNITYGFGQPLQDIPTQPFLSTRNPTTSDMAELGTTWANKSSNAAFVLTSIVSNSATWTPMTVNAGATITTGNLVVSAGTITASGDITTAKSFAASEYIGSTLDITAGRGMFVAGDEGTGTIGEVCFTNIINTSISTGAGKVLMNTANPGDSAGWLKFYSGTDVRYIPFWSVISP